jgi:hypothetical protein
MNFQFYKKLKKKNPSFEKTSQRKKGAHAQHGMDFLLWWVRLIVISTYPDQHSENCNL